MERLIDRVARELKLDRAEVRRRNLIPAEKMPYKKPLKARSGAPHASTTAATIRRARRRCWRPPAGTTSRSGRPRRAREGRYLGIGLAHGVKGTGRGPFESGLVRMSNTGRVSVFTGAAAMGQGLGTALAQICAERARRRAAGHHGGGRRHRGVVARASAASPAGRPSPPAPRCCWPRARCADKAKKLASHVLEAAEHDLEIGRRRGARRRRAAARGQARRDRAHPARRAGLRLPARRRAGPRGQRQLPHRCARLRQRLPCRRGRGRRRDRRGADPALCRVCRIPAC